jgi:Xaa-Pro aminopeptidase
MCPVKTTSPFRARQERLRALMEDRGVALILLSNLINIRYLTGFNGSAGVAVLGLREGILWVDPRYTLQAKEQADGVDVIEEKSGILKAAALWLAENAKEAAFEAPHLTVAQFDSLREHAGPELILKPAGDLIEELRMVKDRGEIESIRGAGKITADVFTELLSHVRAGVSEKDLAAEVEYRMRRKGAEGVAFETIVASGSRSAYPHARPTAKLLQENDLVIFDMGAILDGYAADMTRTVFLGEPGRRVRNLYAAVLKAQQGAVDSVQSSVAVNEVDAVARRTLAKHRLGRYFTHSTGHGVGLEIHEKPRIAKAETTSLRSGAVITIEPGIYLEGFGGIRIEDTVLVKPEGSEILTPAPKEFVSIQ